VWKHAENVGLAGTADAGMISGPTPQPQISSLPEAELQINVGVDPQVDTFVCYGALNTKERNLDVLQRVCGEMLENLRPLCHAHRYNTPVVATDTILSHIVYNSLDYLSYFSSMYAYWRGGLSYKIIPRPDASTSDNIMTTRIERTSNNSRDQGISQFGSQHVTFVNINPVHEIAVPFYSPTKRILCNVSDADHESRVSNYMPSVRYFGTNAYVYRAGKDDFSFGTLIGPLDLIYTVPAET
jgi:hypothetical protein